MVHLTTMTSAAPIFPCQKFADQHAPLPFQEFHLVQKPSYAWNRFFDLQAFVQVAHDVLVQSWHPETLEVQSLSNHAVASGCHFSSFCLAYRTLKVSSIKLRNLLKSAWTRLIIYRTVFFRRMTAKQISGEIYKRTIESKAFWRN